MQTTSKTTETVSQQLLSPNSAARVLDVSRSMIYHLMKTGHLTYVVIGADRRIPVSAVEKLAQSGTAKAA